MAKHIGFAFLKRNKLKQQKQAISTQKLRVWHEKHKLLAPKLLCFSPQYIVFFTLNSKLLHHFSLKTPFKHTFLAFSISKLLTLNKV